MSEDGSRMNRIEFPQTVETERLVLRCYRTEDAEGLLKLVQQNRDQLVREFEQLARLNAVGEAESFAREKQEQWNACQTFCYGIWRKQIREQAGQIQVKNIAWEIPGAELGYFIDASLQRRGYARESIKAILELTLGDRAFQRIFLRILPSNAPSLSLAKALGFQEEGLHRNAFRCGLGKLNDVIYLSLTNEDYLFHRE